MTDLYQIRPSDAPPWAFWIECNSVCGWVTSPEDWAFVVQCWRSDMHGRRLDVSEARQATREHAAVVMHSPAWLSFGFRAEHVGGTRTLADHAAEHGLGWLRDDGVQP